MAALALVLPQRDIMAIDAHPTLTGGYSDAARLVPFGILTSMQIIEYDSPLICLASIPLSAFCRHVCSEPLLFCCWEPRSHSVNPIRRPFDERGRRAICLQAACRRRVRHRDY